VLGGQRNTLHLGEIAADCLWFSLHLPAMGGVRRIRPSTQAVPVTCKTTIVSGSTRCGLGQRLISRASGFTRLEMPKHAVDDLKGLADKSWRRIDLKVPMDDEISDPNRLSQKFCL